MNDDQQQQEFNDEELSTLYRRGATERPSAELDSRILAEAAGKLGARRSRRFRFAIPVSAAAGLLVALGLARLVMQQMPEEEAMLDALPPPRMESRQDNEEEVGGKAKPPAPMEMFSTLPERKAIDRKYRVDEAPLPAAPPMKLQTRAGPAAEPMVQDKAKRLKKEKALSARAMLDEITRLIDQGKRQQARDLLLEYGARYPQLPLPEELRLLLKQKKP